MVSSSTNKTEPDTGARAGDERGRDDLATRGGNGEGALASKCTEMSNACDASSYRGTCAFCGHFRGDHVKGGCIHRLHDGELCRCDEYIGLARHGAAALTMDSGTACLSVQALAEAIDALREREDDDRDKLNIEILERLFQTLRLAHLKGPDIVYDGGRPLPRRTDA